MHTKYLALSLAISSTPAAYPQESGVVEELIVIAHPLSGEGLAQPTLTIDGQELARSVAGTLGETLVDRPGIHSSSFGQAVGRPVIRGLGGARVRVMEDRIDSMDVSVSSPDHATTIEPFIAERIEVLKGPSTLLYGNGAIGGVVDVHSGRIPHAVPDSIEARGQLRYADNADLRTAAGMLNTGTGHLAAHVDGFYRKADDYEIPGFARSEALRNIDPVDQEVATILPGSELETKGGAMGASYVGAGGFIGAAISIYDAAYGLPGGHEVPDPPKLDMEQTRFDLEAALLRPIEGAESVNFRIGLNNYEHAEIESSGEIGTIFDNEAVEARLEIVHLPVNGFTGAGGVQYGRRDYTVIGEEAFVPPVVTDSLGVFWVGERPLSVLDLEAGLRYEYVSHQATTGPSRRFDLLAGSLGLVMPFDNGWTISGQLDYSSRAPVTEELFSNGPHLATGRYAIGNSELDEEEAVNVSAALQYDGDRLHIGISVYHIDFRNFIYQRPNGMTIDDLPVFEWRQADASFDGVDLEAGLTLARWEEGELDVRGFYDQVRARLDQGSGRNLPRIPPERLGLGLRLSLGRVWAKVDYSRTREQTDVAPFELPTAAFNDLRAYLGIRILFNESQLELFVSGRNLTDDEQRHHTSFIKDLAPQPGRTIEGGLQITL